MKHPVGTGTYNPRSRPRWPSVAAFVMIWVVAALMLTLITMLAQTP